MCIYSILACYFNNVLKREYGTSLPWYYPFTVAYWCPNRKENKAIELEDCSNIEDSVAIPALNLMNATSTLHLKNKDEYNKKYMITVGDKPENFEDFNVNEIEMVINILH